MRSSAIFATLFVVTWITAAESAFLATALVLGGLAALKGAALVGFAVGRGGRRHHRPYYGRSYGNYHGHHGSSYGHGRSYGHNSHGYRYGRSVENSPAEEGEDILLSSVGQLDPNGCVLKLLCQAEIKEESSRTIEESILVDMFSEGAVTANRAAFFYATEIGIKTQDPSACKKYFPNCPLNEEQLGNLLQQAWGCGFNFDVGEETGGEEQQEVVEVVEQEISTQDPAGVVEQKVSTQAPTEVSLIELISQKPSA